MPRILSPSIMCADLGNLQQEIKELDAAGADIYHMDIMDGEFVPNFALSWADFSAVRKITDLPMDAHLMVKNPSIHLKQAYNRGADIIYVHYESGDSARYLEDIKNHNKEAGLVINPQTTIDEIAPLLDIVDKVLIMRVTPGYAGQKAIPEVEFKIHKLADMRKDFTIALDGSVSPEIVDKWSTKGVDEFVLGTSSLFGKNRPYREILDELHNQENKKQQSMFLTEICNAKKIYRK